MEASPPECTQTDNRKLLSLAKKTQEPQKASPPLALLPRGLLRGVKFGRGHWLLVLAAIILAGTSSIFGNKKAE